MMDTLREVCTVVGAIWLVGCVLFAALLTLLILGERWNDQRVRKAVVERLLATHRKGQASCR